MTPAALPPDDPNRALTLADPDDPGLTHLAVVGDTYTILVSSADTGGRYTLIDMLIPDGGGPPPHRHDFDEMFHVLDGAIEVTLRGETSTVTAGQTANVPANAPHAFHNGSGQTVRLLCLASPGGLDEYFAEFGDPVAGRTAPAPRLDEGAMGERMARAKAAAARYGVDMMM
jgi:quercetin dioxygenase-like cupin family protein